MIPPLALTLFARFWKPLAAVLLVVSVLLLTYAVGRGHANRAWEKKHAAAVAEWNAAVAKAEAARQLADAEARRIETAWRDHVSQREKEYQDAVKARDARIAELSLAGNRLRSAVDSFVRASQTTVDPSATCGDLRSRVATLGVLVKEADGLAGECAVAADRARDSLALCRGYVDALK
jgi:hypothetical protein